MVQPALAPELGAYVLPGRSMTDPRLAVAQARAAEEVGLGSVYLSERFATKDLGVLGGALAQATSRVTITAAATHVQTRHPLALASLGLSMQALSEERFVLGFGRAVPQTWKDYGLPPATDQLLVDGMQVLRRLWAGETVSYEGPLGRFPSLKLAERPDVRPPPVLLTAIGPKALALAGAHFDGALLHAFLTPEGHRRSVEALHAAAAAAGRRPESVRAYGMVVVAADLPADEVDVRVRARLITYLDAPKLGDSLVAANGWDVRVLEAVKAHPLIVGLQGRRADGGLTAEQLVEVSRVVPDEWFEEGAAVGSTQHCATVLRRMLDAGADEVIVHGSTPELLGPTVAAFARATVTAA